jgi:hypothetical protein
MYYIYKGLTINLFLRKSFNGPVTAIRPGGNLRVFLSTWAITADCGNSALSVRQYESLRWVFVASDHNLK